MDPEIGHRPTSIAEMNEQFSRFRTNESHAHGLAFQPKSTDVIISPYVKSGTTWIEQIVHGLRTRGSMDFEEIIQVIPWIEMALDAGIDLEHPQVAAPRAFKSHLSWDKVPKGARYIYAVRDPKDVLVSLYRFFEGWVFESGTISMSEFAEKRFCPAGTLNGTYWDHVGSWWEQRENPNILILCFEDMKADLPKTVRKIAEFIGCVVDQQLLDIVITQSSLDFMVAHKNKFDEHLLLEMRDPVCGFPTDGEASKVTTGDANSRYEVSKRISLKLDEIWQEKIGKKYGLASYQAFREELACFE